MMSWVGRRQWWITGIAIVLLAVILANWQAMQLGLAVAMSERRPRLLNDAKWDQPASARQFNAIFSRGSSSVSLVTWLQDNHFAISNIKKGGHASKRIAGLPCNEMIQIDWIKDVHGALEVAQARVREAGCL